MSFQERLKLELTLTLGGQSFTIPGGQLKHFAVRLSSHGFTASVTFWTALETDDAALFTAFQKPELLKVKLAISGVHNLPDPPPAPLVVQGLARARGVGGTPHGQLEGTDRRFRRYTIEFADAAQVLWRQHRPVVLYTSKTMQDVLTAFKPEGAQLNYDWDVLNAQQPLLCLGVGEDDAAASFYDFVCWYVDSRGGVWTYDSQKNQYTFSDSKPAGGQAASLGRPQVERVEVLLPPVIRHNVRILNSFTEGATTSTVEQSQSLTGVQHDVLLRTPITSDTEQRQALEKTRLRVRQQQLQVVFRQFPTVAVYPGALLELKAGALWNRALKSAGDDYRVIELSLTGNALEPSPQDGPQDPNAGYQVELETRLEQKSDTVPNLPAYRPPAYPIYVEGKMHSPGGDAMDRIYMTLEDEQTSVSTYRVTVPLWNQTVSVPAEPIQFPGEFYFPPYKNSRVLLALHFDRADIHRFLDWGETVRLPQDGQGDQLLLGKNKSSQTAFTHDYQDNKPVWQLARVSANDTETVRMSEGALLLQTKEVQGTITSTPTYDVTPQVETAKGDLSAGVTGAVGQATAAYRKSSASVNASISSAISETAAALEAAEGKVNAQVATARTTLQGAMQGLSGSTAKLASAATDAKATLNGLR
jgi:hypothetical protein